MERLRAALSLRVPFLVILSIAAFMTMLEAAEAGAPVIVDEHGVPISEDDSNPSYPDWVNARVSIDAYKGGPLLTIYITTTRSGHNSVIDKLEVYHDDKVVLRIDRDDLKQVLNPRISLMRVETYGPRTRNIVIEIPILEDCSKSGVFDYGLSPKNNVMDRAEYNGIAYISMIRYLDEPEKFSHNIFLRKCDVGDDY